jgi:DNA repair exonuclease SbcCD ATPase subunit
MLQKITRYLGGSVMLTRAAKALLEKSASLSSSIASNPIDSPEHFNQAAIASLNSYLNATFIPEITQPLENQIAELQSQLEAAKEELAVLGDKHDAEMSLILIEKSTAEKNLRTQTEKLDSALARIDDLLGKISSLDKKANDAKLEHAQVVTTMTQAINSLKQLQLETHDRLEMLTSQKIVQAVNIQSLETDKAKLIKANQAKDVLSEAQVKDKSELLLKMREQLRKQFDSDAELARVRGRNRELELTIESLTTQKEALATDYDGLKRKLEPTDHSRTVKRSAFSTVISNSQQAPRLPQLPPISPGGMQYFYQPESGTINLGNPINPYQASVVPGSVVQAYSGFLQGVTTPMNVTNTSHNFFQPIISSGFLTDVFSPQSHAQAESTAFTYGPQVTKP